MGKNKQQYEPVTTTKFEVEFPNPPKAIFIDGIEEAAMTWADDDKNIRGCDYIGATVAEKAFMAGAAWLANQGETVDGEIMCAAAYPHENKVVAKVNGDYKFGEKVTIQLRKK